MEPLSFRLDFWLTICNTFCRSLLLSMPRIKKSVLWIMIYNIFCKPTLLVDSFFKLLERKLEFNPQSRRIQSTSIFTRQFWINSYYTSMETLNLSQTGNFIFSTRLLGVHLQNFLSFPSSKHASNQKISFIDHDIRYIGEPTLLVGSFFKLLERKLEINPQSRWIQSTSLSTRQAWKDSHLISMESLNQS